MIKFIFSDGSLREISCENANEARELALSLSKTPVKDSVSRGADQAVATEPKRRRHHVITQTKSGRKISRATRAGWWNLDEIRFILSNINQLEDSKIATSPYLMRRHVPSAVYTVLSDIKSGTGKFSSKRIARLYKQAVASSEEVGEPVRMTAVREPMQTIEA